MGEAGGNGYEIGAVLTCHSPSLAMNLIRSTELSLSSSDLPDMDSQASSSDDEDDERTISKVVMDTDASLVFDMLHDDPEFDSL